MASTATRRPIPALVALAALLLLTGLVWWRVLNRSSASEQQAKPCPTPTVKTRFPARDTLTLTVLNATTKTGIASRARTALINDGFNVPALANNASRSVTGKLKVTAQIAYGPASAKGATLVAYYFPGAKLVPTSTTSKTITVSLGNLYKGVASPTTVAAALKREQAVVGTPTPTPSPARTC